MSAIPMLDEDECILWTGYITPNGYGRRTVKGCREHGSWDRVTPLGRRYCKRCMDAGNLRRRSRAKVAA